MESAAAAGRSSLTALSHRLLKQFSAGGKGVSNLVFSPLSVYSGLSVLAAGARGGTLNEFLDVLSARCRRGLVGNASEMVYRALAGGARPGGPQMVYACGMWHDAMRNLKPVYRGVAARFMGVPRAADFRTRPEEERKRVNASLAGLMDDPILDPGSVDKHTRLVHTSAFALKGGWERPFYKRKDDEDYKFHLLDGSAVDVQFMHSYEDQFVAAHDGFKVLKLPYTVQHDDPSDAARRKRRPLPLIPRYCLCLFLPDAHDGLWALEDKIVSIPGFLHDHLPKRRVDVGEFRVPKFRLSYSTSLKQVLRDIGIKAAFTTGADMPDMLVEDDDDRFQLFAEDVLHKAVIEVNETNALTPTTACTSCGACLGLEPERRPGCVDFVADHPFVFFVVEEFSGLQEVVRPSDWECNTSVWRLTTRSSKLHLLEMINNYLPWRVSYRDEIPY